MQLNNLSFKEHLQSLGTSSPTYDPSSSVEENLFETTTTYDSISLSEWESTLESLNRTTERNAAIIAKHQKIAATREHFRLLIESAKVFDFSYSDLSDLSSDTLPNGTYQLSSLTPVTEGISGTYFLTDKSGFPRFVIKPFDEEAGCINNPKWIIGLTDSNPFRDYMPLYHSAMREVLAYQVALRIGVDTIAPKTVLAIIQSDAFHDLSDELPSKELGQYLEECGPADREKLCSVQSYIPQAKHLYEMLVELSSQKLNDEQIAHRVDQADFEDANILMWATYDTDGHAGNLLVYPKGVDSLGNPVFGLKKIDNGSSFPDKNRQLRNVLVFLDNARRPLSDAAKEKIANIDVEALEEQFRLYGLESALPAFRERISFLKSVVTAPEITIKEVNDQMVRMGRQS